MEAAKKEGSMNFYCGMCLAPSPGDLLPDELRICEHCGAAGVVDENKRNEYLQLQQPAGVAGEPIVPSADLHSACDRRPRLHSLSVEHLAIALKLNPKEEHLVMLLGEGLDDRRVAQRMALEVKTMRSRLKHLKAKTRMSRLSLAILGYQLAGQCDEQKAA